MYTVEEGYWRSPEELLRLLGANPSQGEQLRAQPSSPQVVRVAELTVRPNRVSRSLSSHRPPREEDRIPAKRATSFSPQRLEDDGTEPLPESAISGPRRRGGKRRQRFERGVQASVTEAEPARDRSNTLSAAKATHSRVRQRNSVEPESPVLAIYDAEIREHSFHRESTRQKRSGARKEPAFLLTSSSSPVTEDEKQSSLAPAAPRLGTLPSGPKSSRRLKNMHLAEETRTKRSDDDFSVSVATENSPMDGEDACEGNEYERLSHSRRVSGTNPWEKISVHSNHPAVSSTNALSVHALKVNARPVSRNASVTRRLSPPLMDTYRGKGSSSAIEKPSPGEIVVDRRDGRKLRVIGVPSDGNCGYECLARGVNATLPGPSYSRNDIRRAMRTYVRSNRESVQALVDVVMVGEKRLGLAVPSLSIFDRAIMKRGMHGHWLGSSYGLVEIMIAAKAVGMVIELYAVEPVASRTGKARDADRQVRTVRSYERVGSGANVIRLLFQGKSSAGHFSLLLPT